MCCQEKNLYNQRYGQQFNHVYNFKGIYIYIYNFSKFNYVRNECMSTNKVIQFRIFFLAKISSKSILIYSIYDRYKFEYLYS